MPVVGSGEEAAEEDMTKPMMTVVYDRVLLSSANINSHFTPTRSIQKVFIALSACNHNSCPDECNYNPGIGLLSSLPVPFSSRERVVVLKEQGNGSCRNCSELIRWEEDIIIRM